MRRDGVAEDLGGLWTLGPADLALVAGLPDAGRLGLAAQLAHWRAHGCFPDDAADLPPAAVECLAAQLGVGADALEAYDWSGRTGRRHRRLILDHLAVAAFDDAAEARLRRWLAEELLPREPSPSALEGEVSVHALHLLQSCLVYVNTLMLQRVLAEPAWLASMTPADRRGLTLLVWVHVSPYGTFDLDMERRLDLDLLAAA